MPLVTSIGSGGANQWGQFQFVGGSSRFWGAKLQNFNSPGGWVSRLACDKDDGAYLVFKGNGDSLIRMGSSGNIIWDLDTQVTNAYALPENEAAFLESVTATTFGPVSGYGGTGRLSNYLAKTNKAGSQILWSKRLQTSAEGLYYPGPLPVNLMTIIESDNTGNIVAAGKAYAVENYLELPTLVKFNSSGSIAWQRQFNFDTTADPYIYRGGQISGVRVADSGNIYVTGYISQLIPYPLDPSLQSRQLIGFVAKVNASGSLVWQKAFYNSNHDNFDPYLDIDAQENLYLLVYDVDAYAGYLWAERSAVIKLNASGSVMWQKWIAQPEEDLCRTYGIRCASDGVYLTGLSDYLHNGSAIFKMSFDGNVIWQRRLYIESPNANGPYFYSIDVDGDGIWLGGDYYGESASEAALFRVPKDGSLVGNHSFDGKPLRYNSISKAASTANFTFISNPLSPESGTFTATSRGFEINDTDVTSQVYNL